AGLAVVAATAALLASAPIGEWLIRIDQRRIVRDLQAGRTVEVVGPDGMPRFRWAAVPGSTERFAPDRDGCATLSATAYGGVDLVTVPLPIPVRVEAEVAVLDRRPDGWVAVHVGGLEVGPPRGPGRSQIQFTLSEAAGPGGAAAVVVRTKGSVDALWRPVEGTIAPSTWHSLTRERVEPGPQPAPPHFHPIAIELLPGGVTFLWDRDVAAHLTEADIRGAVEPSDRRHGAPRSTAPVLGPGIGLSAVACTAAVRNVRLVPRFVPATEGRARE
ncbi:MAG: hypothetical protein K2X82_26735, partial [Gemmataceae bacterium]|nr:hypothetical protein [Gemmataceae bacterium]